MEPKLISSPSAQEDVIKQVIENEMDNPENANINEKKLILTDQINAKLIDNSFMDIDDSKSKFNKLITIQEEISIKNDIKNENSNSNFFF